MKKGDEVFYNDKQLGQQRGRVVADLGKTIQICSPSGMHILPRERVHQSCYFRVLDEVFGPLKQKP